MPLSPSSYKYKCKYISDITESDYSFLRHIKQLLPDNNLTDFKNKIRLNEEVDLEVEPNLEANLVFINDTYMFATDDINLFLSHFDTSSADPRIDTSSAENNTVDHIFNVWEKPGDRRDFNVGGKNPRRSRKYRKNKKRVSRKYKNKRHY